MWTGLEALPSTKYLLQLYGCHVAKCVHRTRADFHLTCTRGPSPPLPPCACPLPKPRCPINKPISLRMGGALARPSPGAAAGAEGADVAGGGGAHRQPQWSGQYRRAPAVRARPSPVPWSAGLQQNFPSSPRNRPPPPKKVWPSQRQTPVSLPFHSYLHLFIFFFVNVARALERGGGGGTSPPPSSRPHGPRLSPRAQFCHVGLF